MLNSTLKAALCAAPVAVVLSAFSATAATVTFDLEEFTGDDTSATATVTDLGNDSFKVTVDNVPDDDGIGDITGIFFDFAAGLDQSDFSDFMGASLGGSFGAITLEGFGTNTSNLGGGVNLTGGGSANPGAFDYGLKFAGFNVDDIQSIMFTVDASGLGATLDDFTRFALRLQTVGPVGTGRGGSSKLVSGGPTTVPAIPLPAGGLLMLTALGGIGALGFRRARTT